MIALPDTPDGPLERERVRRGELPPRYAEHWLEPFMRPIEESLTPGVRILDVGSGRRPTVPPEMRPDRCRYVGLDISADELDAAPAGSYDEIVVADITQPARQSTGEFDLVVSWQVFEHVASLGSTLSNVRGYLRDGGRLVTQVSGSFAGFAIAARLMPHQLRVQVMKRLIDADPDTKFRTHYDKCYYGALERLLQPWSAYQIVPRYKGAMYFGFWRPLEACYLKYEDWTWRNERRNLATHYIVTADN